MKKQILTVAMVSSLAITSIGWVVSHDNNQELTKVLIESKNKIVKQSTEIAKLDDVIVQKDEKLEAEQQVIEKQKDQLQKKNDEIKKNEKEINKLKKELAKKPKVVEKVVEKVVYKEKSQSQPEVKTATAPKTKANFKAEEKGSDVGTFEMTSYIAMCQEGCTGITRTGVNVKGRTTYEGHRIIATDPNIIPLWSIVKIHSNSGSFTAISLDTGGGINGNEIDYLVSSESEALANGRQNVSVEIIRKGK